MWNATIRRPGSIKLRHYSGLPVRFIVVVNVGVWMVYQLMWWAVATMLATLLIALLPHSQKNLRN